MHPSPFIQLHPGNSVDATLAAADCRRHIGRSPISIRHRRSLLKRPFVCLIAIVSRMYHHFNT